MRIRPCALAGALVLAFTLLSSCARPVRTFDFVANGRAVDLYLRSLSNEKTTVRMPYYSLAKPISIDRDGEAFFVRYPAPKGGGKIEVDLGGKSPADRYLDASLPVVRASGFSSKDDSPVELKLEVPLAKGDSVRGFSVDRDASLPQLPIAAAGVGPLSDGVTISPGLVVLPADFEYADTGGGSSASATVRTQRVSFPSRVHDLIAAHPRDQIELAVGYSFNPEHIGGTGVVTLSVSGGGSLQSYRLTPNPGSHSVYLYSASCGFPPESLKVSSTDPAFTLESVSVLPFDPAAVAPGKPIPADFGTILQYSEKAWRNPEYELFSWNLIPSVLVFDFRNYDVQGRFLSRLAYFVEKNGFAGRLLTSAELGNLHGWNAHDYRPEDIARFYETAQKEDFKLRPEEYQLRDLLAQNGIITEKGGKWLPGTGAIISVAQSSWYGLRSLLLTHEGYHGVFFTNARYREDVFALWGKLAPGEQLFWRLFLQSQDYNVDDDYLVVNEFQAYLMQQPLEQVDARFRGWAAGMVAKLYPSSAETLTRMVLADPTIFVDTARKLDVALYRDAGVHAGALASLVPVKP